MGGFALSRTEVNVIMQLFPWKCVVSCVISYINITFSMRLYISYLSSCIFRNASHRSSSLVTRIMSSACCLELQPSFITSVICCVHAVVYPVAQGLYFNGHDCERVTHFVGYETRKNLVWVIKKSLLPRTRCWINRMKVIWLDIRFHGV
jgi:hypothetical protein